MQLTTPTTPGKNTGKAKLASLSQEYRGAKTSDVLVASEKSATCPKHLFRKHAVCSLVACPSREL